VSCRTLLRLPVRETQLTRSIVPVRGYRAVKPQKSGTLLDGARRIESAFDFVERGAPDAPGAAALTGARAC
jgi:hypothetical protein